MAGRGVIELTDIELPYIERNTSRHGRTRYYLRVDGRRLGRLPDDPGSEPFTREYWRLRAAHESGQAIQQPAPVELPKSARPGDGAGRASSESVRLDPDERGDRHD